jgi:hypothetical protein
MTCSISIRRKSTAAAMMSAFAEACRPLMGAVNLCVVEVWSLYSDLRDQGRSFGQSRRFAARAPVWKTLMQSRCVNSKLPVHAQVQPWLSARLLQDAQYF